MIVLLRFRVSEQESVRFREQARVAVEVLAERAGFLTADLGRNLDEPSLWTLTTRWRDVGSYRRALQGYESKTVVVPLLSLALDEPSAYEAPEAGDLLSGELSARDRVADSATDRRYPEGR